MIYVGTKVIWNNQSAEVVDFGHNGQTLRILISDQIRTIPILQWVNWQEVIIDHQYYRDKNINSILK